MRGDGCAAVGAGGVMDRDLARRVLLTSDAHLEIGSGSSQFGDRRQALDDVDERPPAELVGREVDVHVGLLQQLGDARVVAVVRRVDTEFGPLYEVGDGLLGRGIMIICISATPTPSRISGGVSAVRNPSM